MSIIVCCSSYNESCIVRLLYDVLIPMQLIALYYTSVFQSASLIVTNVCVPYS